MNKTRGGRIREARERQGLTQTQLAAKIGAAQATVSLIEADRDGMSLDRLAAVCRVLDVSADWILGLTVRRGALP